MPSIGDWPLLRFFRLSKILTLSAPRLQVCHCEPARRVVLGLLVCWLLHAMKILGCSARRPSEGSQCGPKLYCRLSHSQQQSKGATADNALSSARRLVLVNALGNVVTLRSQITRHLPNLPKQLYLVSKSQMAVDDCGTLAAACEYQHTHVRSRMYEQVCYQKSFLKQVIAKIDFASP
jgi:hypothetical protein